MSIIPDDVKKILNDFLGSAPVDLQGVAQTLGLDIFEKKLREGVSGAIVRDPSYNTKSGFVIFVDDNEPYVRQRFTAAHEIGHFVLHRELIGEGIQDNYLLRSNSLSNRVETEANRFAAELIMPSDLVNELIKQGYNSISELAEKLQVSEIAMAIKLGHPT